MTLFYEIYRVIRSITKYLFGIVVAAYIVMTVGIPVYLHYCGGELETVNYVVKGDGCCGGQDEQDETDGGCCKNENLLIKNSTDFTLKELNQYKVPNVFGHICFHTLQPLNTITVNVITEQCVDKNFLPPPKLYSGRIISTSVIRI